MRSFVLSLATATALALGAGQAAAQTLGCTTGGAGGAFPTSGTGNGTFQTVLPSFPLVLTLNVPSLPAGATCVTEVKLNGMAHTFAGDTHFVLESPAGQKINLFCRQGAGNDWGGDYVINSVEQANALPAGTPIPASTISQNFGAWTSGNFGIDNVALSAVPAATGDWKLTIYDWVGGDVGTLTTWDVCFGTPPPVPPPATAPTLTAPANAANVTGLFVNLTWGSVLGAASYEVDVDGTIVAVPGTTYVFQSTAGAHTWTARAVNGAGAGPWAVARTFTDTGLAVPALTAPANAANVTGPYVNFTWGAVAGVSSYDIDIDGTVYNSLTNSFLWSGSTVGAHSWTVRANWLANTVNGNYAVARTFNDTGLAVPSLTAPAANAALFGPNVNFTWAAVTGASSYDIQIDATVFNTLTNSFAYTSSTPGLHTWTVRANWFGNTVNGPYATARTYNDLGVPPTPCSGQSLTTVPFTGGNGLGTNSGVYFDIDVLNPAGISLSQLTTNANATAGTAFSLEIYTKSGTYNGFETTAAAWTLRAVGGGVSIGQNQPGGSLVEFPDFTLPQGVTGFCLKIIGAGHSYTNGNGTNQTWANADMIITLGKAQAAVFTGALNNPRVWNGTVIYNCNYVPPVLTYCTSGTTTNGCAAAISATAQPSVTAANACQINVANVEGNKSGLIFYSISGQNAGAWNTTSFLCVKSPTQRTPTQTSTGTTSLCDGTMTLDWNAYQAAFPGAVGNPWSAGDKVQVQAWFRDPPAGKSTNLSNAIELTYVP